MVTGGRPHPTLKVAIDGQPLDVQHAAPDALVGLTCTSDAQRQRVAGKTVSIESADTIAETDACQVDQIDERVTLIEFLSLQHASDERL